MFVNNIYLNFYAALLPSRVGGILIENLIYMLGRLTLPDPYAWGNPVWPVIVNVDFHALLSRDVNEFFETG